MQTIGYCCATIPFGEDHELHISVSTKTRGSFTRDELGEACNQLAGRLMNEFRNSGLLATLSAYDQLVEETIAGSAHKTMSFNGKQLDVEFELVTKRDTPTPWQLIQRMMPTFNSKPVLALAA